MARPTTIDDLERRRQRLAALTYAAAGAVLVGIAASVVMLQAGAGAGPSDVHLPEAMLPVLQRNSAFEPEVHIAGGAIAALQNRLGVALLFSGLVAMGVIAWALVKRRKAAAKYAMFCLIGCNVLRPVSPPMQIAPPRAVDAASARRLIGLGPRGWPSGIDRPEVRYVLAQIAFIEGDRMRAMQFSAGLTGSALASPIEAPFRLQFLQNSAPTRSTVCYPQGCFSESARGSLQKLFFILTLAALGMGIGTFRLRLMLRRRCERIGALRDRLIERQRVFT
ncbi:MAG TPA: hypothetical protein VEW04_00880 [Allosphingosinicella sp.]|nr:hypothetical protein [Allosphingosinicella sp.]